MAVVTRINFRIGPRSAGMSLTPEEFDDIPVSAFWEHYRYELIRGVLVVTPPPSNGEIAPNDYLGYLLWDFKESHPHGSMIDIALSEQTIYATPNRRRCDRAIWVGLGRVPDLEKDIPAIVIEFVSRSRRDFRRDYEEKRVEYLAIGVREYWIIDRFQRIMTVYQNRPDGGAPSITKEGETYQTALLPGFVLPIDRLLARADDWPPQRRKSRRRPPEGDPH